MSPRLPWPRGGVRTRLPVVFRRADVEDFQPTEISGLALWLDASQSGDLYTTDAGPVTAVSSPTEISGCLCWYDAADTSSVTKDGSNLVSQWNDKSGNARHATTSGSLRPTHGGSQNGNPVMQFTGTQALTITGNFLQSENVTLFAVAMKNTDHYGGIISSAPTNPEDSPILCFYLTTIAFLNRRVLVQQAIGNNIYRIVSGQSAGTAQQGWFDGVRGTDATASVATNTSNTITKIGALRTGSTADLNGNIAEIVCYSGNLSTADRASVEAYLAAKWGIAGVHAPATAASDPVGYWRDRSGNGRHATQATAGSRPTVSATALNGRRQLGLVSQHLRGPSTTWAGSASIYWVGRTGQSANGAIVFSDGTVDQTDSFHAGWLNTQGVGAYGNGWGSGNAPRAESPSAWRNADIVAGVTLSSTEAISRVNGATTNTAAALTGSLSQASAAQFYIGRESSNTWNNINGSLAELLIYQPALNASQRLRVERYLAAKYGITLAPQVSNADAQDWINRVYANGGTVSASTASAVNAFCDAIENAPGGSLRDRFYRLNLFCGTGLNACLVPLYRGQSLGGAQFGGTTDTNNGPFLPENYNETGVGSGLNGNGSTRFLNTGVPMNFSSLRNYHLSAFIFARNTAHNYHAIGADTNTDGVSPRMYQAIASFNTSPLQYSWYNIGTDGIETASSSNSYLPGLFTGVGGTSANNLYVGGSSVASAAAAANETNTRTFPIYVFGYNRNGSALSLANARMGGYSIGLSMTAAQVEAYNAAFAAFNTVMTRS